MSVLERPEIGTHAERWQFYPVHLASSYILREYFLASYYCGAIRAAEFEGERVKAMLAATDQLRLKVLNIESVAAHAEDLSRWAVQMRQQEYHEPQLHAFIGMFAAFEAGIDDMAASIIRNDRIAAQDASVRFKNGSVRYPIVEWPWSQEICIEVAGKLEKLAIPKEDRDNIFRRIRVLFGWLGLDVKPSDPSIVEDLAEANYIRNVTLHRSGLIEAGSALRFPRLAYWVEQVPPMNRERFDRYYHALTGTLLSIDNAMRVSRHCVGK